MINQKKCNIKNIKTDRLFLREYKDGDFYTIYNILANSEVIRYLFDGSFFSESKTKTFIINNFCGYKAYGNLIIINNKNNIVGFSGIQKCESFLENDYEFGFVLDKIFWGNGYATEIGEELINYSKYILKNRRIIATVHPKNEASINVMKKLNMKFFIKKNIKNRGVRNIYIKEF